MANKNIFKVIEDIDNIFQKGMSFNLFIFFNDWWYKNKTTRSKLELYHAQKKTHKLFQN
ncbi:hypothetical protein J4230_04895 [Candidatus Woesearchaeota archaeon]|nr:hypothetical protein [Candidatus Woesearchaeota archaeon]